jgi:hypothetical protein
MARAERMRRTQAQHTLVSSLTQGNPPSPHTRVRSQDFIQLDSSITMH